MRNNESIFPDLTVPNDYYKGVYIRVCTMYSYLEGREVTHLHCDSHYL